MRDSSRLGLVVCFLLIGGVGLPGCSDEKIETRPTAELNKPVDPPTKADRNSMDIMAERLEKAKAKGQSK